jgi:hypothetical protein
LDRRYAALDVEEDVFINYGFVSRDLHALMHPREKAPKTSDPRSRRQKLLAFVRTKAKSTPPTWTRISRTGRSPTTGEARRMRRPTCSRTCTIAAGSG